MTAEQLKELENNLWKAADKLRADSGLKASEYSTPILGLIFLRFASIEMWFLFAVFLLNLIPNQVK